jgi:hypothetical protein
MISIHRLIYAGYSSEDFDLCCQLAFDSDSGETNSYLSREAVASETYRGDFKRVHSYKFTESLAPTITFIDKNFGDIDSERQRKILKWLTSKDTASFLTIYHDDTEVVSYEILGGFTEIQTYKLGNGRVVGFTAVFESISPWAFSPLQTITKNVSAPTNNKITINLETDDLQSAVYPRIIIQQDSTTNVITIDHEMGDTDNWVEGSVFFNGTNYYWVDADGDRHTSVNNASEFNTTSVAIKNTYTDDYGKVTAFDTLVKNNIKGEIVTLDGANRVVSSSSENRIFGNDFSWQWIPLYEGKNELSFVGNCTVTVEFRTPIKCGEF